MSFPTYSTLPMVFAGVFAALGASNSLAQSAPDAGSILRDFERSGKPAGPPRALVVPIVSDQPSLTTTNDSGPRFFVSSFKISGATVFSEDQLRELLGDLVNKDLSLTDLQKALERLSQHYRQHGYFVARAYLPAQDIQNGVVSITILEGTIGEIVIRPTGKVRLSNAVVENTMRTALPADAAIRAEPIERGLLLMYDLPGVQAQSTLSPGNETGTSTLTIDVSEGPLLTGALEVDNFGNRFSGQNHVGGTINVNNPSGIGDQITLRAAEALDTRYTRLSYKIPAGASGLQIGIDYAKTSYALCCEFAALDAKGHAREIAAHLIYPLVRSRNLNVYGTMGYSSQRFFNFAANLATSESQLDSFTIGLRGTRWDSSGEGNLTDFSVSLTDGQLNLDGLAANRAQDAVTAQTHGHYQKSNFALARQQQIASSLSIHANLSGQFASKNLASAEKFVLGGPDSVRAYPTGEASGDEGWLATMELAYQWNPALEFLAFVDHGEVLVHKNIWPGANVGTASLKNRYTLSGAGLGFKWNQPGSYTVRGLIAFPIGENPGRDFLGNDADGKQSNSRLWLQAIKRF